MILNVLVITFKKLTWKKVRKPQFYLIVFFSAISNLENAHFKQSQCIFSCLQHYSYINNCQILTMRSSINSYSLSYPSSPLPKDHLLFNIISSQYWSVNIVWSEKTDYSDGYSKTSQSSVHVLYVIAIRKFCLCLMWIILDGINFTSPCTWV